MSQSPIRLHALTKTHAVDALPLLQPKKLFKCLYQQNQTVQGCFEGEEGHRNFVVNGKGPRIRFRSAKYELRKIHLHLGSEHIIEQDDKHDMELHFVHTPVGSSVAMPYVVIGVLFVIDKSIPEQTRLGQALKQLADVAESNTCTTITPLDLFPECSDGCPDKVNWFHYEGSLTSFPYSENVSWIVMRSTARIREETVQALKSQTPQAQREVQPLDRRIVVRSFLTDCER